MSEGAGRRFTSAETASILRRATDAEARPTETEAGLTLEELVAAAREAGIDPAAVRRAAAVAPTPVPELESRALGAAAAPELRARFEGRLPSTARAALRDAIERAIGRAGALVEEGTALVWHEEHGSGRTTVRVQTEGTTTLVAARADRRGHLILLLLGLAAAVALALVPLGGFAGLAAALGPPAAVLIPVAAPLAAARALWPALQRRTARRLERALLAVGELLEPDVRAP